MLLDCCIKTNGCEFVTYSFSSKNKSEGNKPSSTKEREESIDDLPFTLLCSAPMASMLATSSLTTSLVPTKLYTISISNTSSRNNTKKHFTNGSMQLRRCFAIHCSKLPPPGTDIENENKDKKEGVPFYGWGAGIATLGFAETSYLTYMKLTNGDVYCPVGGAGCGDVLSSVYADVFGLPLSLVGMISYGMVGLICLELFKTRTLFGIDVNKARWILFGITSSMTSASAYFMYLLIVKMEGASCAYCVTSALLSLSLLLISLQDFKDKEIQKAAGLQTVTAIAVIAALTTAYGTSDSAYARLEEVNLPPVEPVVTTQSSPLALSLANHLHSIGAKLYGAFWCSHCYEQKQMFGAEASKLLDYVECYPNGYKKGIKIAKACEEANIKGFPTWIINGKVISGEKVFPELARESGFDMNQSNT